MQILIRISCTNLTQMQLLHISLFITYFRIIKAFFNWKFNLLTPQTHMDYLWPLEVNPKCMQEHKHLLLLALKQFLLTLLQIRNRKLITKKIYVDNNSHIQWSQFNIWISGWASNLKYNFDYWSKTHLSFFLPKLLIESQKIFHCRKSIEPFQKKVF